MGVYQTNLSASFGMSNKSLVMLLVDIEQDCYNWGVLEHMIHFYWMITDTIMSQQELEFLVDIERYTNLSMMAEEGQRPNFAIAKGDKMMLLELTVLLWKTFIVKQCFMNSYW